MIESSNNDQTLRASILLTQYEVCAGHHLGFYSLIWQVPAIAITIGGGLATIVLSASMPIIVRVLLLAIGGHVHGCNDNRLRAIQDVSDEEAQGSSDPRE